LGCSAIDWRPHGIEAKALSRRVEAVWQELRGNLGKLKILVSVVQIRPWVPFLPKDIKDMRKIA
jgi:hypothetical protein